MAEFTRRQFATTMALAAIGASSGRLQSTMPARANSYVLDISFHGLWVFYRYANMIKAYAFTDPGKEHCFVGGWFHRHSHTPTLQCMPEGNGKKTITFNNLTPLNPKAFKPDFADKQNSFFKCYDLNDLEKDARAIVSLPAWPADINSIRHGALTDDKGKLYPGSLIQRLSYFFEPGDLLPTTENFACDWNETWANRANVHFYAEPDHSVNSGHVYDAMCDVIKSELKQGPVNFTSISGRPSMLGITPQEMCLSELRVSCPCDQRRPEIRFGPFNALDVANCMGIVIPPDPGTTAPK